MQRRPTSFDIAALAGVSQPTVSRALNNSPSVSAETRARVLAAAEQLNYKVDKNASGLRRSKSRTLALAVRGDDGRRQSDQPLLSVDARRNGPQVRRPRLRSAHFIPATLVRLARRLCGHAQGRRHHPPRLRRLFPVRARSERLVERGTHFVRWGSTGGSSLGATVGSDNEQGGFDATEHLLQSGRRTIAFIGTDDPGFQEFHDRWRGYCRAHRAPRASNPTSASRSMRTQASRPAARRSRSCCGAAHEFDAVFAACDVTAIGAMHALQMLGRSIPADVAIVGFDDIPAASLSSPPFEHRPAGQPQGRRGTGGGGCRSRRAWDGAIELLPVKLVVRESSRPT